MCIPPFSTPLPYPPNPPLAPPPSLPGPHNTASVQRNQSPGMVFLQGLPFDRMVDQIARRIPGNRGGGGLPFGFGGGGGGGGGGAENGGEGAATATAAATGEGDQHFS